LRQFEKYLDERSLRAKFESSAWYKEPSTGRQVTQTELDHFNIQEQQLKTRLTFTDFNDPASLGSWALEHLSLPLSLEQESLLVHFQKLKRTPPAIPADRYLAMPEALFPNPVTSPANEAGFWVNLSGIYEFIPFVSDQLLNVPRSELNVVELSRDELQAKLIAVSEKQQQLQYLQDQLAAFSGLEHTIGLYRSAASSLFEEPDEIGELTSSVFERHLQAYETREIHLAKVSKDQQAYQAAHQQFMSGKNSSVIGAGGSKKIIEYMQQQYGSADFNDLVTKKRMELAEWDEALNALLEKQEVSVKDVQRNQTVLFGNAPALIRLFEMQTTAHTEYGDTLKRLETLEETLKSATLRRNQAITKFMQDHKRDFDPVKDLLVVDGDPNEQASIDAKSKFEAAYELAGKRVEDQTVLKDHVVGVLAHQLLPTVFPTYDIQEELIEEKIDRRLSDLINELKKIGSRKVEILHQIFTQVQNTYNAQLTQVNNIANYLRNKNHGITGGNQATLVPKSAPGYPDGWMKAFRKRLSDELQHTGLFETAERQDIEQIMLDIFREHKGTREATYKDLLNPLSYFDLHFTMKLDDGQGNVGSNGQTYTANALLCLARLSLIEEKDRTGIRIMPIDEAEGLGGNYEMLHALAQREGYQIVTMSIETAGDLRNGGQYVYIMHDNRQANSESYVPPLGIFNNGPITKHIDDIFKEA
jgi:exonuclease SbcC